TSDLPSSTSMPPDSSSTSTPTVPATVTLAPGATASVPDDLAAGSYRSTAEAACEVMVITGDGQEQLSSAAAGETIEFTVADGDQVTIGDGCPASYTG
ncbi:MAG: hypothetical protein ACK5PP_08285, partial [Acidimicrobiales bacterium]